MNSRRLLLVLAAALASMGTADDPVPEPAQQGPVIVIGLQGPLMPVAADYLDRGLELARTRRARLVLVELDTPGGLVTTVRRMVQSILDQSIPVAVFVGPAGAQAASGGVFLVLAADVALMAPVSDMGAAHPIVPMGENRPEDVGLQKAAHELAALARSLAEHHGRDPDLSASMVLESRSFSAQEALAAGLVDGLVADRRELLAWLHGRSLRHGDGREVVLDLEDVAVESLSMNAREKVLSVLSEPMVAFFLLAVGLLGLYTEITHPGALLPGAVGVIGLLLFALSSQFLPVNWLGAGLLGLGLGLLVLEVKIVSYGALTVGGLACMMVGGLVLFDVPPEMRLPRSLLVGVSLGVGLIAFFLLRLAVRAQLLPPSMGREALVGMEGESLSDLNPEGKVLVHGEYYDARSDRPIGRGRAVVVEALDGRRLRVRPAPGRQGE